jgi:hypothetical protein
MLIHVQITTFWLQRKLEQKKQRQAVNNMNKLMMFETKQVTPDLTKNLNLFFLSKGQNQSHLWTLDKLSRSPTLLHPPKMPQYTYRNTPMSIAEAAKVFLNVATLAASVALPLYMAMNYPLSPFDCSIKWVIG